MKRFRFYQISGYIETDCESLEKAKDLRSVLTMTGHETRNNKFVYAVAIGEPVEIDPKTGDEIR